MNSRTQRSGEQHWRKVLRVQQIKTTTRNGCVCNRDSNPSLIYGEPSSSQVRHVGLFSRLSARIRNFLHSRRKYEITDSTEVSSDKPAIATAKVKPLQLCHRKKFNFRHRGPHCERPCQEKLRLKRSNVDDRVKIEITADDINGIKEHSCHDNNTQRSTDPISCSRSKDLYAINKQKSSMNLTLFNHTGSIPTQRMHGTFQHDRISPVLAEKEAISLDLGIHIKEKKKLSPLRVPTTTGLSPKHPLVMTTSCPPKASPVATQGEGFGGFQRLLKTWPIPGMKISNEDNLDEEEQTECLTFIDRLILQGRTSLADFSIPFKTVELAECLKEGRRCKIYKGRWHGDVTVHLFSGRDDVTDTFWMNLTKLCRIRHENIILFMAACTEPPDLAVITSFHRGTSLYEHIHVKHEKISMYSKVQMLRQIALGMGYLHAKGIVLRRLNTHNVFLCPRVKLSAMDWGIAESVHDRSNYAVIPHHQLTYVAPEILASACVKPPRLVTMATTYSKETDIFAFGTVMYEIFAGQYPFEDVDPMTLIWQVCGGRRQQLDNIRCTTPLKKLMNGCWCQEPFHRPEFSELSKQLLKNFPLHKRHSSSEPERLHTLGKKHL
ncbi:hypothetical protein SNE40_004701 [Patella caerulea]|uniref:Protein kinase domain-containing protein n=1 Tax=Patella caerulea TaxID=87958 RepID=A0AAN8PXH8_PATCE